MKIKPINKKHLLSLILALTVFISLYVYFSAKKQPVTYFDGVNAQSIPYKTLIASMSATPQAYFFCTASNADCRYIDTEMLDILLVDAHVERFDNVFLVDTSTMDQSVLPSALQARFGFSDVPAFAVLSYENGQIVVHSVLQWTSADPFTMLDLKDWMKENNLWLKNYTN